MGWVMVSVHRSHLILVVEEGLGQAAPGAIEGSRSKKIWKALHVSWELHNLAPGMALLIQLSYLLIVVG
jgi:hypothetical protein